MIIYGVYYRQSSWWPLQTKNTFLRVGLCNILEDPVGRLWKFLEPRIEWSDLVSGTWKPRKKRLSPIYLDSTDVPQSRLDDLG